MKAIVKFKLGKRGGAISFCDQTLVVPDRNWQPPPNPSEMYEVESEAKHGHSVIYVRPISEVLCYTGRGWNDDRPFDSYGSYRQIAHKKIGEYLLFGYAHFSGRTTRVPSVAFWMAYDGKALVELPTYATNKREIAKILRAAPSTKSSCTPKGIITGANRFKDITRIRPWVIELLRRYIPEGGDIIALGRNNTIAVRTLQDIKLVQYGVHPDDSIKIKTITSYDLLHSGMSVYVPVGLQEKLAADGVCWCNVLLSSATEEHRKMISEWIGK